MEKDNDVLVEEENDAKTKSKKLLIILVGVIFVVGCYFVGYYVGTKMGSKEEENDNGKPVENVEDKEENIDNKEENVIEEDNDIEVDESLTKDSQIVKDLFEIFREDSNDELMILRSEVNTNLDSKLYIAYTQIDASSFKERMCDSLSVKEYSEEGGGTYFCGSYDESKKTKVLDESILENKFREIFGKNAEYCNDSFNTYGYTELAYYDAVNKLYANFWSVGGYETPWEYSHFLESINQSGKFLSLNTKLVGKVVMDGTEYDNSVVYISYTFELEKETGNYIFVSREEK